MPLIRFHIGLSVILKRKKIRKKSLLTPIIKFCFIVAEILKKRQTLNNMDLTLDSLTRGAIIGKGHIF
jgi:hypothetical protein